MYLSPSTICKNNNLKKTINSNNNLENNQEVKLVPEMLNLLGCNKENFIKLIRNMNYKLFEKNNETYFKYNPRKINYRQKNKFNSDNPFNVLNQINFD